MEQIKVRSPEYLSSDILDEDFVQTFSIVHKVQYILGSCSVNVKYSFVTAPTNYQKTYTLFCIFTLFILNVGASFSFTTTRKDIFSLSMFSLWYTFASYACNIINIRFLDAQLYSDFYIRMQKLDRLMKVDKIKGLNLIMKKINLGSMYLLLFVFITMFVVCIFQFNALYVSVSGIILCNITIVVELTSCSNLIVYFFLRVRFINCVIKKYISGNKSIRNVSKSLNLFSNKHIKELAKTHDFSSSDTHIYLKEIFSLFSIFQKLYRLQLFTFCLKLVFGSLCSFGIILLSNQSHDIDTLEITGLTIYQVTDIFIAFFIGVRLQLFFEEIKEIKRLSIAVMAECSDGQLREKARKMLKMAEETPPKFSVYDMYDMDGEIFISIFSLVTSLIVTLLQFALL